MKKIITGILVFVAVIALITLANGVNITPETKKQETTQSYKIKYDTTTAATTTAPVTKVTTTTKAEEKQDVFIDYDSAVLAKDYAGKPILIVTYKFMHRKDDATSFTLACTDTAYQNGVECDSTVISDYVDTQTQLDKVKPGVRYDVVVGYHLKDTKTDVVLEVYPIFKHKDDKPLLKKTISFT